MHREGAEIYNTAGVPECENVNRTREAGNGEGVEDVVANTLKLYRDGTSPLAKISELASSSPEWRHVARRPYTYTSKTPVRIPTAVNPSDTRTFLVLLAK